MKKGRSTTDKDHLVRTGISHAGFLMLFLLNMTATAFTMISSRTEGMIMLYGNSLPLSAFTGVFSSLANMLLIFMVVFYDRPGLILSIVIIAIQTPSLVINILTRHNLTSIPGLFNGIFTIIAIILIYKGNKKIKQYKEREIENLTEKQMFSQKLFEQTATALVNAIDAKDTYSHGHSLRVAEYSKKIAEMMGKSDEECYKIYYAALLHDVGKIGIDERIINKKGRLTDEEYEVIKQHPDVGNQILSSINEYPYLSIGAHYHHERYDGKGYPDKLKGEDIPEIARIISVADAYDAMSSHRSYRDAIPQQLVREEIIKGAGSQFDPQIASIMQHLIDMDTEYHMKERTSIKELAGKNELRCRLYRSDVSDGILITECTTKIHLKVTPEKHYYEDVSAPAMILFDSLDERVHDDEKMMADLNYFEYCEIFFDGRTNIKGARKTQTETSRNEVKNYVKDSQGSTEYDIEAVRYRDHALISIDDGDNTVKVTIALPDSSRFAYIGLTGEKCLISDVAITKSETPVDKDHIGRIAEEISYIKGPQGDVPNVQIDNYRTDATVGIPVTKSLTLTFHTMSLPTARLIWHCPFIDIFHSADRKVNGQDYREYALVRLDGENWNEEGNFANRLIVNHTDDFNGWEAWKKGNKEGFDCTVRIDRKGDRISVMTENFGVSLKNTVTVTDGEKDIYVSITGDQVAITNVRVG
ncbi:MAG: HD-GYP domain-containing protein [Lachnospiraceae bacterium]|nr:HD-GYP domain-containing protein [Lachnospiraceae bacterium]